MTSIVSEIVEILVSGITGLGAGIGAGLTSLVKSIFVSGTGTSGDPYTLSVYGGVIVVFAAISLAVGLSTKIVAWVSSLGN